MPVFRPTHIVHKILFKRTGKCNRCGICCVDEKCPHYAIVDGLPTCLICNKRGQKCEECSTPENYVDHSTCIRFPNHPWLKVIKKKECSYQFTRLDKKGNISNKPLPFMELDKK